MSELDDLKKENKELQAKIVSLEFESKLNRFLADKRADTIRELLQSHNDLLKRTLHSEESKVLIKLIERIKLDNEKYDELQKYLMKTFPKILKIRKNENTDSPTSNRDDLSTTYIGEDGNVYAAQHIIDVTMIIINSLKKQLEDVLGSGYEDNNDPDLF